MTQQEKLDRYEAAFAEVAALWAAIEILENRGGFKEGGLVRRYHELARTERDLWFNEAYPEE